MPTMRLLFVPVALSLVLLVPGRCPAQTWWNADYTRRVAVTLANPRSVPTPSPATAEVTLFPRLATDGATTPFDSLPAGQPVLFEGSQDDNLTVVSLPFAFPFGGAQWKRLGISPDGYVTLGGRDAGRPDTVADAARQRLIAPWSSDFAITDPATQGVWATLNSPDRVVIRWVVAETSPDPQPTLARFALILTPDGGIRFVYGSPCGLPSADTLSYSPVKVGIGNGDAAASAIAPAFVPYSGHADIVYDGGGSPVRSDREDIRVARYRNGVWTELSRRVFHDGAGLRVVFRLAEPLAAGAVSAGEYFVYFGNPSPAVPAPDDVRKVYDCVADFTDAGNIVGSPAPNWIVPDTASGGSMTVIERNGTKQGLLAGPAAANRAIVAPNAMPAFLNPEVEARLTPLGGGERAMAIIARTPNARDNGYARPSTAYAGGIGWLVDALGDNDGFASFVNPEEDPEPVPFGLTERRSENCRTENVLFRVEGNHLFGKTWHDREAEPGWMMATDYATADVYRFPETDPAYRLAGAVGIAGYAQDVAVEYVAVRELGLVAASAGAVESSVPAGPFIQGTVRSSAGFPLPDATVTVTDTSGSITIAAGPDGRYRLSRPPGVYTVSASAPGHSVSTREGIVPSATTQTDFVLACGGVVVEGTARDAYTNAPAVRSPVTLTDAAGGCVASAFTDDGGRFQAFSPVAGALGVSFTGGAGDGFSLTAFGGVGQRVAVTTAAGEKRPVELTGTLVGNGDMETPAATGEWPLGWTTSYAKPVAWLYSTAVNHTPGGSRSIGVKEPPAGDACAWNPPPAAFWPLPTHWRSASVTFSVWVYFTEPGQVVRLRFRNGWESGSVTVKCGLPPPVENENQGGLVNGVVPVLQWYEIRKTHTPSDPALDNQALSVSLYHLGTGATVSGYTAEASGTVYFDDFRATVTSGAETAVRIVDTAGMPVGDALVASVAAGDTSTGSPAVFLDGDGFHTNPSGVAVVRVRAPGSVILGAWRPVSVSSDGELPSWGWTSGRVAVSAIAAPAGVAGTLSVRRAGDVARSAAATATTNAPGAGLAVDGSLLTAWDTGDFVGPGEILSLDLGAVRSLDQFEFFWDRTAPKEYAVYAGESPKPSASTANLVSRIGAVEGRYGRFRGLAEWPLYPGVAGMDGAIHVLNLGSPRSARYIEVKILSFGDATRVRLQELRALSNAVPPAGYYREDVLRALRICGGLTAAGEADRARLDVAVTGASAGRIDLADVRMLLRELD
jgi:hypothetical protein